MAGVAAPLVASTSDLASARPLDKWGDVEPTCEVGSITRAQFGDEVGSRFVTVLVVNSEIMEVRYTVLSDVIVVPISPEQEVVGGECFRLVFTLQVPDDIPQGTYRFVHRRLGAFDMFVVPIARIVNPQAPPCFEAILNRMPSKA